jgi:hypothetical protein
MSRNDRGTSTSIIIAIAALILAAVVGVFVLHQHQAATRSRSAAYDRPTLSTDQRAYLSSFEFGDLRMSAAVNFLGDTVTYLDGTVINKGEKMVRRLDVELNFVDTLNQVVLRETAHPVAAGDPPLKPGESHPFRVTFDHMPADWNQGPPKVTAVNVEF